MMMPEMKLETICCMPKPIPTETGGQPLQLPPLDPQHGQRRQAAHP